MLSKDDRFVYALVPRIIRNGLEPMAFPASGQHMQQLQDFTRLVNQLIALGASRKSSLAITFCGSHSGRRP